MTELQPTHEIFGRLEVGRELHFRKTVSESDVYLFAGITGDFHPNHVDAQRMEATEFRQRMAHGALIVGFMSTASAQMLELSGKHAVSLGYDRIRFIKPVHFGDTVQVNYKVTEFLPADRRMHAKITVVNQRNETVAVGIHIAYFSRGYSQES